jgi:hypothetical protein
VPEEAARRAYGAPAEGAAPASEAEALEAHCKWLPASYLLVTTDYSLLSGQASHVPGKLPVLEVTRSTFDRLPYGCLLFMYRLDLTRNYN